MGINKKDQVQRLVEKSKTSLKAAARLYEEGFYDYATSRAYYSMFYLASAALLTINLSFSKHSAIIAAFGKHFAKTKIINPQYHNLLREAFRDRTVSDYDFMVEIPEEEAKAVLANAKKFQTALTNYLNKWLKQN